MEVKAVGLMNTFEQTLMDHTEMLYAVALRLTRNALTAERLAERTLLEALRHRNDMDPRGYIKAWLLTTLRNLFIADCRERTRRLVSNEADCEVIEPDSFEEIEAEIEAESCLAVR